ncbi:CIC11C00000001746 [Sungouiella intermedia]|uniref:CIC11C00000001376 n=1 Tax=Sungouiella intermedia TaxID=45354 RepID=A0A1L0BAZ8_9ASCO|nr:CIC11C00000001746 [[Candida] intermedia]SGZ58625.1 CIC11C00000001376 [[Candida] intermedia]
MSSSRQRVQQVRNPVLPAKATPEQKYWRRFLNPQLIKENHPITHIHFNPVSPHDFAVTSSTRIQVFSSKTRQVIKTFSRFKDVVYSGEYRYDGKLLVAADALGLVSIFDAYQPRNLLVSLSPSSHPTHVAKFHPTVGNQLITGSDDRVVRLYDISQTTSGPIVQFDETFHGDYIRSCNFIPGNPNLVTTGCYDGIVRIFDTRQQQMVALFDQGNPVEDVLALSPTTLVSAGGPKVRVWDLARGSRIQEFNNFAKTATTLHDTGEKGLLVGSLDGHVKVFDYTSTNWDVKFGWKFGSGGVLCSAVSPNFKHFATGLTSGLLSIRTRKTETSVTQEKQARTSTYARIIKGSEYHGEEETTVVYTSGPLTKKLKQFEKHLNAFKWAEALDSAVTTGLPKEQTVSLLNELKKRGKIRISLYGRDEISLMPILQWFIKNIEDVRSFNIICDFVAVILEMYGNLVDKSVTLEEAFANLSKRITTEVKKCREANEISGMLELLAV